MMGQDAVVFSSSACLGDIPCEIDEDLLKVLQTEGIDDTLARHMAHLFTRDPLDTWREPGWVKLQPLAVRARTRIGRDVRKS